jgi:hypothetical protein
MNIFGEKQYLSTNWFWVETEMPSFKLAAFYQPINNPIAFGVKGEINDQFVQQMIAAIEKIDFQPQDKQELTFQPASIGAFEACAFLKGAERNFMRGWSETEEEVTHAFPIYLCELNEDGLLPVLSKFLRSVDVCDPLRQPEPYFKFKMLGGASKLRADNWSTERYSTLKTFVNVLSNEKDSKIDLLNRHMHVLSFSDATGWNNALEKIHSHLLASA